MKAIIKSSLIFIAFCSAFTGTVLLSYSMCVGLFWASIEGNVERKVIEMTQMEFLEAEFKPRKHDWLMDNKPGRKEKIRKIYKEYRAKDK